MRFLLRWFAILALLLLIPGCTSETSSGLSGEFEALRLAEAPALLQAEYQRLRGVPGMVVMQREGRTYLLLMAGRVEQPGLAVEVLEVRRLSPTGKDVRVLAVLRKAAGTDRYPFAVIRLEADARLEYSARLSVQSGKILELQGVQLEFR